VSNLYRVPILLEDEGFTKIMVSSLGLNISKETVKNKERESVFGLINLNLFL